MESIEDNFTFWMIYVKIVNRFLNFLIASFQQFDHEAK